MEETKLQIRASIVEQSLQLFGPDKSSQLSCVAFGPTFYGTDKVVSGYLFNNGPEPVKWVSILEEGADGEEAVSWQQELISVLIIRSGHTLLSEPKPAYMLWLGAKCV